MKHFIFFTGAILFSVGIYFGELQIASSYGAAGLVMAFMEFKDA